ncbi:MAG: hypothetical protein ABI364_06795 [Caldimonas sp.]
MKQADGYKSRRVIVIDAETRPYKRHRCAYGKQAVDGEKLTGRQHVARR